MQRSNEHHEGYPQNRDNRREESHSGDSGPRNYRNPDPLKAMGQYSLSLELPTKKLLVINKSAIITVSVM